MSKHNLASAMPKGPHERFFEVRGSSLIPMLNPKLASARKTVTVIHPPLANRLAAAPLAQTPKSSTSEQARPFRTEAARPSGPCIAARKGAPTQHGQARPFGPKAFECSRCIFRGDRRRSSETPSPRVSASLRGRLHPRTPPARCLPARSGPSRQPDPYHQ